jgi:spoIIIJ-associated protein
LVEEAKKIVETLLSLMGVEGVVEIEQPTGEMEQDPVPINLNIRGEDLGFLIGRQGHTLSSLQRIARLIVVRQLETRVPIIIDVEGYSRRRREALRRLALRLAGQVIETGRSITLEPMSAAERRIIHITLADYPRITTQSTGQGEARKLVIMPENSG